MKKRLENISKALINYSVGNFRTKLRVSTQLDEVDAVIAGINMLGEELRETTISKNFFNDIFNSVSEMMFVVNFKGIIQSANNPALENLALPEKGEFEKTPIDDLVADKQLSITRQIKRLCDKQLDNIVVETDFIGEGRTRKIPVRCVITPMDRTMASRRFLVTLHDLTPIRAYEQSLKKSEEKYRKIFEDSSDCIFICDPEGYITEINTAGRRLLLTGDMLEEPLNIFNFVANQGERKKLITRLKKQGNVENTFLKISCADGSIAECLLSANVFFDTNNTIEGIRGIIKNITLQKETEKLIIRTIVDTQEKERIRFAKDIHDSLGQQLSAIKFYIGTSVDTIKDKKQKEILQKSNTALITMLADMRSICFNLMPKTLENFGLVQAIRELCNYPGLKEQMQFNITATEVFPVLNKNMEIGIFRIVQEFINNAQKHGKASKVDISLKTNGSNQIKIILQDNGRGFDTTKTNSFSGMGLKNVQSRVSSYNGDVAISSIPNKGTRYIITFPLDNKPNNYGSNREKKATHQAADR